MPIREIQIHADENGYKDGDGPPSWSGRFEEISSDQALLVIHIGDERTHPIPQGWCPDADSPLYLEDREIWVLDRE